MVNHQKSAAALIELHHCSLVLDDRSVLDRVSFQLREGERWALIGSNGSGKTLLLRLLRGELWPTPTDAGDERRSTVLEREQIAYVGPERQDKYIRHEWDLSVRQVVTTGLFDEDIPLTESTRAQDERVSRMLRRFQLWGLRERSFLSLSYGQRRLALVARAFISPARVLLLDEVFNGLADKAKLQMRHALEAPRAGREWVMTTHRPKELPGNITHVAQIDHGRIIESGPVAAMRHLLGDRERRGRGDAAGSTARRHVRTNAGTDEALLGLLKPMAAVSMLQPTMVERSGQTRPLRKVAGKRAERVQADGRRLSAEPLGAIHNATLYRDYRRVIKQLDWQIDPGCHWAVLGGNGSGKSTVLSLIHGDLHPALGGSIERQGMPAGTHIELWKQRVGWVSPELQADYFDAQSLEDIVISGRYSSIGLNEPATVSDRRMAGRWMTCFGIAALRARGPGQVSYGQLRMALFARAMMNNPQLLLLNEPCTGLDTDTRASVLAFIEQLAQGGTQIVMAVHDVEDIVPSVKQVLKIDRGGLCQSFTLAR